MSVSPPTHTPTHTRQHQDSRDTTLRSAQLFSTSCINNMLGTPLLGLGHTSTVITHHTNVCQKQVTRKITLPRSHSSGASTTPPNKHCLILCGCTNMFTTALSDAILVTQ